MTTPELEVPQLSGVEVIREDTRRTLAFITVTAYFLILGGIALVGWQFQGKTTEEVIKVLTTTAGVLGGIVGAVVGFYFKGNTEGTG